MATDFYLIDPDGRLVVTMFPTWRRILYRDARGRFASRTELSAGWRFATDDEVNSMEPTCPSFANIFTEPYNLPSEWL